jgi:hypothetical protein
MIKCEEIMADIFPYPVKTINLSKLKNKKHKENCTKAYHHQLLNNSGKNKTFKTDKTGTTIKTYCLQMNKDKNDADFMLEIM